MALRHTRLKFIWGASGKIVARWKLGLWGFYERKQGYPDSGLAISVRGVLLWFGLLTPVLAYVCAATAVFFWLDRKEYNHVTYTDALLLPIRWDEVQTKRGQAYLDEGMADLEEKRWAQGLMKLRIGLARYPQALEPRMTLAQYYHYSQRHELALKVLEEGMDVVEGYPGRDYVSLYLKLALIGEDHDAMTAVCDRYLAPEVELPDGESIWLLQQKVVALLQAKQAPEALALLKDAPESPLFNEQRVLIMLEMGEPDRAIAFLKEWVAESGESEQTIRLQVRAYRDGQKVEAMNERLALLRKLRPADPRSLGYAVVQQYLVGDEKSARASLEDFFFRFSGFEANMTMMATPLAEIGAVELLRECLTRSEEQGYELYPLLLLMAQAQIKASDWAGAFETTERLSKMSNPQKEDPTAAANLQTMSYLARIALNPAEGLQVQLLQFIEQRPYPFKFFRNLAEILLRAERYDVVLEVIARANQKYPGNRGLDAMKDEASEALAAIAAERPEQIKPQERPVFVEDAFFEKLDGLMAAEEWSAAAEWVRKMQQARPSWMKVREAEILMKQIAIAHHARDVLEMTLAARMILDGSLDRSQLVVDYAVELEGQGEREDAVRLMKEVSRKSPSHALSRRYLNEWTGSDH